MHGYIVMHASSWYFFFFQARTCSELTHGGDNGSDDDGDQEQGELVLAGPDGFSPLEATMRQERAGVPPPGDVRQRRAQRVPGRPVGARPAGARSQGSSPRRQLRHRAPAWRRCARAAAAGRRGGGGGGGREEEEEGRRQEAAAGRSEEGEGQDRQPAPAAPG